MTTARPPLDRSLPLRERKKLRTRRALADAALRLFTQNGFDATTLEELAEVGTDVARGRLLPVDDSGHLPQWEQPGIVHPGLIAFLREVNQSQP